MSIATDIEVNWNGTVDNTNKIGLSKPLNQLSVDVFDDADYCLGYQNKAFKLTKESESYPHSTDAGADNVPFYLLNNVGYTKNTANEPDGVYYRTILIAVPNGFTWGWDSNLRSNNSQVRIVTKLDLQKNKLYFTTTETQKNALTTSDVYLVNESIENTTATGNFVIGADTYHIRCADIYLTENGYYIKFQTYIDNMYDNFNPTYGEGVAANFNYDANSSKMYSVSPVWFANVAWVLAINGSGNPNTYYIQTWNDTELDIAPDADNADIKFFAGYRLVSPYYWRVGLNYSVEYALWIAASYGLLFEWNGVAYKPVIEYGALKGYTNDMSVQSDIDNWTDVTGHNISPTPPVPPTPPSTGDDFDAMVTGFTNNIGGSAKYWLLSSDPSGLFEDFFLHAPEGSSITQNILSCYVSALKHDWQTVQHKMVIYTNGSQKPAFESQATYAYIYQNNPHKVLGVIEVPRVTNTFYDFSPYTTYEVYVPFCGWIGLPDTVAGRTIRVYMDFDASICTCKARVECEVDSKNVIVGEISGTFGSPCPIQVTEGGLYRQAAINSALQIASGVASGTLGAATKHGGPLAIGGFSYALQGLTNAATAGNTNYSQTIGRSGDSSNLAGTSHYCYLRITHPEVDEVVNNTRFGHTVGYLCNTIGRIGDFEGFTVCGNPHVTGIACTESEKEEIKRMLEDGIIINKEE